ncbi:hypothetical protein LP414_27615 [Polaromonas sp. P1(28)-13]|nr:hypothetical protein LP414_27615 [Polaromonas sp. P1(28)-13]
MTQATTPGPAITLTQALKTLLQAKVKTIGRWTGVRFLKNKGLTFEQAHIVMFNCLPRL